MKTKVCVITDWLGVDREGLTTFVNEQNRVMAGHCEIKCLFPKRSLDPKAIFFSCKIVHLDGYFLYVGELGWVLWFLLFFSRGFVFFLQKIFKKKICFNEIILARILPLLTNKLWRLAYGCSDKPELFHAHSGIFAGWIASRMSEKYQIPYLLTEHTSSLLSGTMTCFGKKIEQQAIAKAWRVLVVSDALKKAIIEFGRCADKVFVVHNLVDDSFFCPSGQESGLPIILTVSSLGKVKNIPLLLQAFKLLLESGIKAKLVVGGDGQLRKKWENLAISMGLDSRVCEFVGSLSRLQVREWMRKCSVFALSSTVETFGCVLAEAQSCGRPVVTTSCGGPESIVTSETGILVQDICDPKSFAKALEYIIVNKHKYDYRIIRNITSKRFGRDAFREKLITHYKVVLRGV